MSQKEDRARLIVTVPQSDIAHMVTNGKFEWTTFVNMQGFASNLDDLVHVGVEYVTPLLLSQGSLLNFQLPIEVLVDLPQQYSYETATQTSTHHMALMERDNSVMQTTAYTNLPALPAAATMLMLYNDTVLLIANCNGWLMVSAPT